MTEWHNSTNTSAADLNVFESLGLLFYIANPATTSFETVEKCPDYVNQVDTYSISRYEKLSPVQLAPYVTALIVLEAAINHFYRGRAQNLADSVTSISSGLLMTAAGLSTRLLMVRKQFCFRF